MGNWHFGFSALLLNLMAVRLALPPHPPPSHHQPSTLNLPYGKFVVPIRNRSHSRAAPRPSLKAQTTRL